MSEYDKVIQGRYTSDGNARNILFPSDVDSFELVNETDWGGAAAVTNVKSSWQRGQADGTALGYTQIVVTNALASEAVASDGYTLITADTPQFGALVTNATSSATNAVPIRVTINAHGLQTGDIVQLQQTTGAAQISLIPYLITRIDANDFDLDFSAVVPSSAATQVRARKVLFPDLYTPELRHITNISLAASAVVTFSTTHGYSVGQQLRFHLPLEWGTTQMDELQGFVTAVSLANNTVTVDINSSAFTAFKYPTNAQAVGGVSPATANPIGDVAESFVGSTQANGFIGLTVGSAVVGPNNKVMYWKATKAMSVQND